MHPVWLFGIGQALRDRQDACPTFGCILRGRDLKADSLRDP